MRWRISLKLETGWARSDGTWLDKATHSLQSASGPSGQLISTLRLARLGRIYRAFDLFQLDRLRTGQLQDLESLRSHHNKGGMQCFSLDANWILVSTPTRTSWHFDLNRRIKLFVLSSKENYLYLGKLDWQPALARNPSTHGCLSHPLQSHADLNGSPVLAALRSMLTCDSH